MNSGVESVLTGFSVVVSQTGSTLSSGTFTSGPHAEAVHSLKPAVKRFVILTCWADQITGCGKPSRNEHDSAPIRLHGLSRPL
jgi:hypothetical protein